MCMAILTASFDCLEYSKTWGRCADGALKESYLSDTTYTCFKLVGPGQCSVAPTDHAEQNVVIQAGTQAFIMLSHVIPEQLLIW